MSRICVIGGAGYVGLVTGVGLASLGHDVVCVDVDASRIAGLQRGDSPILEDGLDPILADLIRRDSIEFTTSLERGLQDADAVFIAVATPSLTDGRADLSQAISVAQNLGRLISRYTIVAVKSTMPVGTLDLLGNVLSQQLTQGEQFDIVSNPEFLREGHGLHDFFLPDRIVVGTDSETAAGVMRQIYAPLIEGTADLPPQFRSKAPVRYLETDPATAQMIKYASNAYLATRISFVNEISGLGQRLNVDVGCVMEGLGLDPRIGSSYLQPGMGFGGPCLEKDLTALIQLSQEHDYDPVLLKSTLERNNLQLIEVQNKLIRVIGPSLYGRTIAILGLAFKEGTNDVRNSLAIRLMEALVDRGATVHGHDLVAVAEARERFPNASYFSDVYEALEGADAAVLLNSESVYLDLDLEKVSRSMRSGLILDTRGMLDSKVVLDHGLQYDSIG